LSGSGRSEREVISDIIKTATPESITTTDAADKAIHQTSPNKKYRVKLIYLWNTSGADITVTGFRFGSGTYHFLSKLGDKSGFLLNLVAVNWQGSMGENFMVKASAAGLEVTVFGEEIA